jgi:tetratricopeptide (TPR) repeat protein
VSSGLVAALVEARGAVLALLCAPAVAFGQPAAPATSSSSTQLTFGVTLNASQRAGDTFTYAFAADEGRTYLIEVKQDSLDLIVTVQGPSGASEAFNSPARREGDELILLERTDPGTYIVELRSEEHTGAVGGHTIRVSAIAELADARELAALRLMSDGAARNHEGGQTAWVAASDDYVAAAELWRALAQSSREAQAKFAAAMIAYWNTKDRRLSAELAAEAAKLYADSGDEAPAAKATFLQGSALIEIPGSDADRDSHYARALTLLTEAAAVQARLGRLYDLGHTQNNIGLLYFNKNDWRNARRYWTEAATLFRSVSEWSGELYPLGNLAVVDLEDGYVETAIEEAERTLELMPANGNVRHRADTLNNLGGMQRVFGRYDEAVRSFSNGFELGEQIEDPYVIGKALFGIGETYYSMGELELAGEYLRAALPKRR